MCQIMLTVCEEGGKIHWIRKRYCEQVQQKFPSLPESWDIIKVIDKFVWSPMEGCEGLTLENPVISKPCGSGAGWSSYDILDDTMSRSAASDSEFSVALYEYARDDGGYVEPRS